MEDSPPRVAMRVCVSECRQPFCGCTEKDPQRMLLLVLILLRLRLRLLFLLLLLPLLFLFANKFNNENNTTKNNSQKHKGSREQADNIKNLIIEFNRAHTQNAHTH